MDKHFSLKRILLFSLLHLGLVQASFAAFPPENERVFVANSLRLLESHQYSYLSQYFKEYFPIMVNQSRSKKTSRASYTAKQRLRYVKQIVQGIPLPLYKETVLNIALSELPLPHILYCMRGDLYFLSERKNEALSSYKLCDSPLATFYQALVLKSLKRYKESERIFKTLVSHTKQKAIQNEIYLSLAFIKFKQEQYSESMRYALQASKSLRKLKALYFNYLELKQADEAQKTLLSIKKIYAKQGLEFNALSFD